MASLLRLTSVAIASVVLTQALATRAEAPASSVDADSVSASLDRASLRIDRGTHIGAIRSIAASKDGRRIVTGSEDRTIRLWDAQSGEPIRTLRPPSMPSGDEGKIYAVTLSPDGRWIAAAGSTRFYDDRSAGGSSVYLFDADRGTLVRRLPGPSTLAENTRVERLLFSSDGKRMVSTRGSERTVGIYDLETGSDLGAPLSNLTQFYDADFDPQGRLLLCRRDGVQLHDPMLRPTSSLDRLPGLVRARFSPDGTLLALLYSDGRVELRRARDLKPVPIPMPKQPPLPLTEATALGFASDGKSLVIAAQPADLSQRQPTQAILRRIQLGTASLTDTPLPVPTVHDLATLPDGAIAFAASDGSWGIVPSSGPVFRVSGGMLTAPFDALRVDATGQEVELRLGPQARERLRFSVPNLSLIPADSGTDDLSLRPPLVEPPAAHRIVGWQHSPPVLLDDVALFGRTEDPSSLAISSDRQSFVVGTARKLFGFRFSPTERQGCSFLPSPQTKLHPPCFAQPLPSPVQSVNLSGDGKLVIALLGDGSVRWFDASSGTERLTLLARPGDPRWLLYRPDGQFAASPGGADLAGFQLNFASERAPMFVPLSQLAKTKHRPEPVSRTLSDTAQPSEAQPVRKEQLPPTLTVLTPRHDSEFSDATVTISVRAQSVRAQGTVTLHTRVDGRVVKSSSTRGIINLGGSGTAAAKGSAASVASGAPSGLPNALPNALPSGDADRDGVVTVTIPVPARDCVVAVSAEDENGSSAPAIIRLRYRARTATADPSGRTATEAASLDKSRTESASSATLRVLAIGVDDYLRPELALRYPGKDATDLAAILTKRANQSDPSRRLYQALDVQTITGRDAKKDAILAALDAVSRRARASDTTILFFAGHGINDRASGEYYFLPVDAEPTQPLQSMISASTLRQILESTQGRILLLLDTCHAGNVLGPGGRRTRGISAQAPLLRVVSELSSVEGGIVVMAAATTDQASLEEEAWKNGAFAKALIEGLSGRADLRSSGRVTVNMLDLYVSERVKELTDGIQTPATAKPATIADFPILLSR